MNNKVVFSVIMPCYNSAAYVRSAVDSLLNQTYPNWELIAVNDGSTDDTLEMLEGYAQQDTRIKVYSKKNGGYATAINYGLDRITGDYFLMLGSDDRLAHDLFQRLVDGIREEEPDIIAFRSVKISKDTCLGNDFFTSFDTNAYLQNSSIDEYYSLYPQHAWIMFVRDTAKCYKTNLIGGLRYFGKYGVDADGIFSSLFVRKCHSFMSLPIDGYYWTIRDDSVSAVRSIPKELDSLRNWKEYLQVLLKENYDGITDIENDYIIMPFNIACILLKRNNKLNIRERVLIHNSLILSIKASQMYNSNLKIYKEILCGTPIKSCVFQHFPITFLFRHGFV